MGKKIKTEIDWLLDKGSEKGDVIMLVQHAQTSLGVVSFLGQAPLHDYYSILVNDAYEKSVKLHNQVLELPIYNNSRHIFDQSLLAEIYRQGSELIVNLYLMYEHLTLHAGITIWRMSDAKTYATFENKELKAKLKQILIALDASNLIRSDGYGVLFADIERARHSINHPKGTNIYSADPSLWDDIPIAWFVSGKHLVACSKAMELYNLIHEKYVHYSKTHKRPGEIILKGPIAFKGNSMPKRKK